MTSSYKLSSVLREELLRTRFSLCSPVSY